MDSVPGRITKSILWVYFQNLLSLRGALYEFINACMRRIPRYNYYNSCLRLCIINFNASGVHDHLIVHQIKT